MVHYATVNACRRRQLLGYFGERLAEANCGGCDVCTGQVRQVDATTQARIVMSAVARTGERYGAAHVVDVVTGAETQRVRDLGHDAIKTYGAGKGTHKRTWRRIIDDLVAQECLAYTDDRYPVLRITHKGREVLFGRQAFHVLEQREPAGRKRRRRREEPADDEEFDRELFEQLRSVRRRLARAQGVPPYIVFSDRTLREMAQQTPTTPAQMHLVTGVGDRKLQLYGDDFLAAIRTFLQPGPGR